MPKTPTEDKKPVKGPRQLKVGNYKSFRLQKTIKTGEASLPHEFALLKGAFGVLRSNWRLFAGIMLVYGLLNVLLVQSFAGTDVAQTKDSLGGLVEGKFSQVISSAMLFAYMASTSGNINSSVAGAYQLFLTVTTSLALVWALRQVYAQKKVRIRDAFYRGMYPLVPFLLVVLLASIQLLPIVLGGYLYNLATEGIAASAIESLLWGVVFFFLALISLYMLSATIFALYVACLPDVEPGQALGSARELVEYRRWAVMRRVIFLPIFLLVLSGVVVIPLVYVAPVIAGIAFFVVSMTGLPIIHSYLYRLYRELL